MAIEVPAQPKIYTTKYDSFKGVDFTNDQTNVWRRRSPTGRNMLPDASGRPFKRHGWEILISNADICAYLEVESCTIQKCAWFEIGGVDHIAIFTDSGLAFYNGVDPNTNNGFTAKCDDYDCYSGYDRCFFFEGNGTSAFYIYGNFKVWRYESDFALHDVTNDITIPTVLIGTNANGAGTFYNGYNLLGTKAAVEYNNVDLFEYWCSEGLSIKVDEAFKTGKTPGVPAFYQWKWNGSSWSTVSGGLAFPSTQIDVQGTKTVDDQIIVVYCYGVMLPNNVSQNQLGDVRAWASRKSQYEFELEVVGENDTETWAMLHTDPIVHEGARAWIDFVDHWQEVVTGEDFIKVSFPSVAVTVTQYGSGSDCHFQGTADLVGV